MLRTMIAALTSSTLCLAPNAPLLAQDYRPSAFDAPQGATATLNVRVPLGGRRDAARPTLGLTVGYGQAFGSPDRDGRRPVRQMRLADIRLDGRGVERARLAGFDLANLDRLGLVESDDKKNYLIIMLGVAAGITAIVLLFNDHDEDIDTSPPDTPNLG